MSFEPSPPLLLQMKEVTAGSGVAVGQLAFDAGMYDVMAGSVGIGVQLAALSVIVMIEKLALMGYGALPVP